MTPQSSPCRTLGASLVLTFGMATWVCAEASAPSALAELEDTVDSSALYEPMPDPALEEFAFVEPRASTDRAGRQAWAWESRQHRLAETYGAESHPWKHRLRWSQGPLAAQVRWQADQVERRTLSLHGTGWRADLGHIRSAPAGGPLAYLNAATWSRDDFGDDTAGRPLDGFAWRSRLRSGGSTWTAQALGAWEPDFTQASVRRDHGLAGLGLGWKDELQAWQGQVLAYRTEIGRQASQQQIAAAQAWESRSWPLSVAVGWNGWQDGHGRLGSDGYAEAMTGLASAQGEWQARLRWVGGDWAWPLSPRRPLHLLDETGPEGEASGRTASGSGIWRLQTRWKQAFAPTPWGAWATALTQVDSRMQASASWTLASWSCRAWVTSELRVWSSATEPTVQKRGWRLRWQPLRSALSDAEAEGEAQSLSLSLYGQEGRSEGQGLWPYGLVASGRHRWARLSSAPGVFSRPRLWYWEFRSEWPAGWGPGLGSTQNLTLGLKVGLQGGS